MFCHLVFRRPRNGQGAVRRPLVVAEDNAVRMASPSISQTPSSEIRLLLQHPGPGSLHDIAVLAGSMVQGAAWIASLTAWGLRWRASSLVTSREEVAQAWNLKQSL